MIVGAPITVNKSLIDIRFLSSPLSSVPFKSNILPSCCPSRANLALAFFIATLGLALGAIRAAIDMHLVMLKHVFHWKMGRFDMTPLGRILNRFSKDVDVVDNILPQVLRSWIMMFFGVNNNKHLPVSDWWIGICLACLV